MNKENAIQIEMSIHEGSRKQMEKRQGNEQRIHETSKNEDKSDKGMERRRERTNQMNSLWNKRKKSLELTQVYVRL